VVVHRQLQAADDALLVALVRQEYYRHETRALERPELGAQPERIVGGKPRGHDDALVRPLSGALEPNFRLRDHLDLEPAAQDALDLPAGGGILVHQEHARRLLRITDILLQKPFDADVARRRRAEPEFV